MDGKDEGRKCEPFAVAYADEIEHIERARANADEFDIECEFTDDEVVCIINRLREAWRNDFNRLQNRMIRIARSLEIRKGDTGECEECGKTISLSELAENFGWCGECMDRHLREDGFFSDEADEYARCETHLPREKAARESEGK